MPADTTADAATLPEGLESHRNLVPGGCSDYDLADLPEWYRRQVAAEAEAVLARHDPAAEGWVAARRVSATYATGFRRVDAYEYERGGERRVVVRTRERAEDDFPLNDSPHADRADDTSRRPRL